MSKKNSRNKGGRRAHLKRFSSSVVNAGRTANKLIIQGYAHRARSLAKEPDKATYENNQEHYQERRVLRIHPADSLVNNMRELWTSSFWQGYDVIHRLVLVKEDGRILILLCGRDKYQFIQQNSRSRNGTEGKFNLVPSFVYPNREYALSKFPTRIAWDWSKLKISDKSIMTVPDGPKLEMENFVR